MRKVLSIGLAVATSLVGVTVASPASAGVKWNGTVVEVINKLPSDWPVKDAVNWLDQYTGSDIRIVKKCHDSAIRCITIKNGRLKGSKANVTGYSQGSTITIDVWKTRNVKPFKGKFGYHTKKYLLVHELAHQRYMQHVTSCNNVMNPHARCNGHVPPLKFTATQKKKLAKY